MSLPTSLNRQLAGEEVAVSVTLAGGGGCGTGYRGKTITR